MKTRSLSLLFSILLVISAANCFSQSYGLGFYSHEVVQDQRTGLDLSPNKTLCFNEDFKLDFDLAFFPGRDDYFGYIARLIVNGQQNIDLIYDKDQKEKNHFKVILGDRFTRIAFNIPSQNLFSGWSNIRLRFNYKNSTLQVICGNYNGFAKIKIKKGDCFKVLFGANEYLNFKNADNPPMKIRNIRLSEDGGAQFNWPLDEYQGNAAREKSNEKDANVIHPLWVKKMHYEWQLLKKITVNGAASIAFDPKSETVHIIERDSLLMFSIANLKQRSLAYANKLILLRGNHSLYDTQNNRLLNFYTDQKMVSIFDPVTRKWSKHYDPAPITNFWQFNKFYSPIDSSLYILGGYGHFTFKNSIQRYHFPSDTWKDITYTGDTYVPRYLAALGTTGKGAYFIGGYGSSTGRQMLNPRNLYDLLYFDVKTRTIKKVYDLKVPNEGFVFANSLVINEKSRSFYGLVFPKHKYNSHLQLIVGSLDTARYEITGSKIPFEFHDINSYADLYYAPEAQKYIAVTTFRDSTDRTHVAIYALNGPPLMKPADYQSKHKTVWPYVAAAIFVLSVFLTGYFRRQKKLKSKELPKPAIVPPLPEQAPVISTLNPLGLTPGPAIKKSSIFLFGNLQVFDDDGNEITKQFTPLIKELFLVILLYTIRWESGISSEKLKELLWFDKSADSARNNRSVNIAKLKYIIEKTGNCQISNETGYWRINIDQAHCYVDYKQYMDIIRDKKILTREKITALGAIIKRGPFLSTINYEWMDSFRSEISNEIIDTYLHFANSIPISEEPELLIELANYIFYFDSINEEAMAIKCKALVHLGKHSQAKLIYENFCREYKILYNVDFGKSFNDVLTSSIHNL